MRFAFALLLAGGLTGPAWSQDCPAPMGWASPHQQSASRVPGTAARLKLGGTVRIGLLAQNEVRFALGEATRKGFAGLTAIDVPKSGTLELVLDNKTYVDLVRDGRVLDLAGEPRGHGCPGIQKALDFNVQPGRYVIQLSGSSDREVKVGASLR